MPILQARVPIGQSVGQLQMPVCGRRVPITIKLCVRCPHCCLGQFLRTIRLLYTIHGLALSLPQTLKEQAEQLVLWRPERCSLRSVFNTVATVACASVICERPGKADAVMCCLCTCRPAIGNGVRSTQTVASIQQVIVCTGTLQHG